MPLSQSSLIFNDFVVIYVISFITEMFEYEKWDMVKTSDFCPQIKKKVTLNCVFQITC